MEMEEFGTCLKTYSGDIEAYFRKKSNSLQFRLRVCEVTFIVLLKLEWTKVFTSYFLTRLLKAAYLLIRKKEEKTTKKTLFLTKFSSKMFFFFSFQVADLLTGNHL